LKRDLTPWFSTQAHKIHPKLGELYDWGSQYWNFAMVGAVGVVWQYLITWLLMGVGLPWWFAMAIGIFVAFNSNFVLNKSWVFKNAEAKVEENKT
jgi:putative flippase GtrA